MVLLSASTAQSRIRIPLPHCKHYKRSTKNSARSCVTSLMQELDFSAQIKAANFDFTPKTQKFEGFKLSENGEKFLTALASENNKEILVSVAKNAIQAAQNFHRVGFSDLEVAVARISRFAKHGDARMLTNEHVDLADIEYALAKVTVAQHKLKTSDFLALAEEQMEDEEDDSEDESEDEDECECEDSEMKEVDGKTVCAKCGLKKKKR